MKARGKRSAKGAEYESQGQARSEAERVAPGKNTIKRASPEKGVIFAYVFRPFRPERHILNKPGATRFALAPGFYIPRRRRSTCHFCQLFFNAGSLRWSLQ
jgi:hypothetical protein